MLYIIANSATAGHVFAPLQGVEIEVRVRPQKFRVSSLLDDVILRRMQIAIDRAACIFFATRITLREYCRWKISPKTSILDPWSSILVVISNDRIEASSRKIWDRHRAIDFDRSKFGFVNKDETQENGREILDPYSPIQTRLTRPRSAIRTGVHLDSIGLIFNFPGRINRGDNGRYRIVWEVCWPGTVNLRYTASVLDG